MTKVSSTGSKQNGHWPTSLPDPEVEPVLAELHIRS